MFIHLFEQKWWIYLLCDSLLSFYFLTQVYLGFGRLVCQNKILKIVHYFTDFPEAEQRMGKLSLVLV